MFLGTSMKLTDKRVDRMLTSRGITEAALFYSPMSICLTLLALLLTQVIWIFLEFPVLRYWYLWSPYLLLSYLFNAHRNNSFAIKDNTLYIINPNFPFRHITRYEQPVVQSIIVSSYNSSWPIWLACFTSNFVMVITNTGRKTFYCAGLVGDAFDENWTEKTTEDLEAALLNSGFNVAGI